MIGWSFLTRLPVPPPRIYRRVASRARYVFISRVLRRGRQVLATIAFLALPLLIGAQSEVVSDNAVIDVAERMYCPVCENIPLDECQTSACLEWQEEIRAQLGAGRSPQQVIESFVARFGDQVVGVPQDPLLRALTFIMPILATALALGLGLLTFRRFGSREKLSLENEELAAAELSDDAYRRRLEEDVRARR